MGEQSQESATRAAPAARATLHMSLFSTFSTPSTRLAPLQALANSLGYTRHTLRDANATQLNNLMSGAPP